MMYIMCFMSDIRVKNSAQLEFDESQHELYYVISSFILQYCINLKINNTHVMLCFHVALIFESHRLCSLGI